MRKVVFLSLLVMLAAIGCHRQQRTPLNVISPVADATPVSGPFNIEELQQFSALSPIDSHTHVYRSAPPFFLLLQKLNIHVLDILITRTPDQKDLETERQQAWEFVHVSNGRVTLCSTFNPFAYRRQDFAQVAIVQINHDFAQGAVAVKIWRNLGEQVKDANGSYILPDNPVFDPIYRDIAAHNKTLIAHVADPDTMWEAPNPAADDYSSQTEHSEWYMYKKSHAPSKEAILRARDHLLEENPNLRVVGAHLGSMEANFDQLSRHLDRYPNFSVDIAGRMSYFETQPRKEVLTFITRYQNRLIYGTDNEFHSGQDTQDIVKNWENTYANDWRYFATDDVILYRDRKVQGLALPPSILHKIYHDNAIKWFPGIVANPQ